MGQWCGGGVGGGSSSNKYLADLISLPLYFFESSCHNDIKL